MTLLFVDQIYDNIHGYISITAVEDEIIRSPIFQRLRHVKQLGLANLVFPGAEHSRFAHSLGVMHIVHRLTQVLAPPLDTEQQQLLRVGALLHDVGHFPLSHAMELALEESEQRTAATENQRWAGSWARELLTAVPTPQPKARGDKLHEFLGMTIIQETEIAQILDRHNLSPLVVTAIAMGKTAELDPKEVDAQVLTVMSQMLHSQIDADRIDYLLRDSNFSGVEAGGFDLPKLYKEACWAAGQYGFKISGLRAVEQFLMTRHTNYRRIVLNKHVQAFERMAKDVYLELAAKGKAPSFKDIESMLKADPNAWVRFNDHYFMYKVADCVRDNELDELTVRRAKGIMNGQPLIEVKVEERYCTKDEWVTYSVDGSTIPQSEEALAELAQKAGVQREELQVIDSDLRVIDETKDPIGIMDSEGRLLGDILRIPESLIRSFAGKRLFLRRLYCLDRSVADKVRAHV